MEKIERVLIISYNFFPEKNPRSYRTFELSKELGKRELEVDVIIPDYDYDYSELSQKLKININKIPSGYFINKSAKNKNYTSIQNIKKKDIASGILSNIYYLFYLGGRHFEFWFFIFKKLSILRKEYDIIISIGLPFSVHLGTSVALRFNPKLGKLRIADYGDPFSYNPDNKFSYIHRYIEKWALNVFDYITVPSEKATPAYSFFKRNSRVKVIPQGFDMTNHKNNKFKTNACPKFAYAGIFYKNIRNPKSFFEFLIKSDMQFNFILFTDMSIYENRMCIEPYLERLGDKIEIREMIERDECIDELGKCDFLINVDNTSNTQVPSKLIDYYLSGRPVCSFNQNNFDPEEFLDFLKGNYSKNYLQNININQFDIQKVTDQFLNLFYENNSNE